MPIPVTVIRHRRERVAKCSLRHLHERPEIEFLRDRPGFRFDASGFTLLEMDAPPLSTEDASRPLLILDSTWRWLPGLRERCHGSPVPRSLPDVDTAYPRVTKLFEDPSRGLASVEALYIATVLLGEPDPTLLDGYHFKDEFLANVDSDRVTLEQFGLADLGSRPLTNINTPDDLASLEVR